jgi:hypothetical protein
MMFGCLSSRAGVALPFLPQARFLNGLGKAMQRFRLCNRIILRKGRGECVRGTRCSGGGR